MGRWGSGVLFFEGGVFFWVVVMNRRGLEEGVERGRG